MDFRILGPMEVAEKGRVLGLPGPKARAVLSILLLHPNEVVSIDRLIDELWGAQPPETAANTIQVYVSQLRKRLAAGAGDVLMTRKPGYLVKVEPGELDVERFESLLRDARAALANDDPEAASAHAREALALWRGPPLPDLASEFGPHPEIARLEEEHLVAIEDRIEADLALGRHDALIGELEAIVAEHRLRERPRRMLMLALYRSGRQAEALDLYQRTRHELVEELGIDPSPALQRLEKAILMQDSSLDAPVRRTSKAAAVAEEPQGPIVPARESRRTVTVLYASVSIESGGGARLDTEARARIVSRALQTVTDAIARHGGVAEPMIGDALLGVFGIPKVHEDDALRGVRAAAESREAVIAIAEEIERERNVALDLRVGVSTGEVMTTGAMPVSGEPVSLAGRLAQSAPGGGVVLDAATERLVLNAVRVKPVGHRPSGGRAATWLLSEVLEGAPAFARRLDATMVGREVELAQLLKAFEQTARESTAYLFTVLGPAGIGKSRLAQELRASLADEATVLLGRCLPYGKGITFWPLAEVVAQVAGDEPRTGVAQLLAGQPDASLVADRIAAALGLAESSAGSEETFWAVRKLLEGLARRRPLVVVFDDIHWAEPTFLDLIEHVADLSRSSPILILCLARPELLDDRPTWGGGKLNASSILLTPLSDRESTDLMHQLVGESKFDEGLRTRVAEAAEGNPLFIEQMLAMLADEGSSGGELSVPPTIQALLAARLDRLEPVERIVLEQAAVVGKDFWRDAVAQLMPEQVVGDLATGLQALVRKDLIRPAASLFAEDDGYRFRHQLIRDAAYDALPKQERAESHQRFAGWLDEALAERAGEFEEIVGYHLEQAYCFLAELGPPDADAVDLARRASERLAAPGRRAYNRGDLPAAVNLLSRATSLLSGGTRDRAALLADLGEALRDAGNLHGAESSLQEAIETAAAVEDGALRWRTEVILLRVRNQLNPELTTAEIGAVAEQAREQLEQLGDDRGLASAWWMLAWNSWLRCRAGEAEVALLKAIEHGRRAGAGRVEAHSINLMLGAGLFGPLPVEAAIERCEEVLAQPWEARRIEASACRALAVLKAMQGRFDEARGLIARDRAIIDDLGLRFQAAAASEGYGLVELLAGDPKAAEQELRRGIETLREMEELPSLANVSAVLAQALYAEGRYSEALTFSEVSQEVAAADDLSAQIQWRGPRAKVLARRGRKKKAESLVSEAVELAAETDWINQHADALIDAAEVRRLDDRLSEAVAAVQQAIELYQRKGNLVSAGRADVLLRALGGARRSSRRVASS